MSMVILSSGLGELSINTENGIQIERISLLGSPLHSKSGTLFGVETSKGLIDGSSVEILEVKSLDLPFETVEHIFSTKHSETSLEIELHIITQQNSPIIEVWLELCNVGLSPINIDRIDSISFVLEPGSFEVRSFEANGSCTEFTPKNHLIVPQSSYKLETLKGRSSNGDHPYFLMECVDGRQMAFCVSWSGNWIVRFESDETGSIHVNGGLHDHGFSKTLNPGERMSAPEVVLALGNNDVGEIASALMRTGRERWYPSAPENFPPTEWNHWWPYIDKLIDEETFKANVDAAVELGLEICTLDAGWYGKSDGDSNWYETRGDWDLINSIRFPSGIRSLSDYTHARGMKFGLWCEIEALGTKAEIVIKRPDYPALRDGNLMGYLCLGNPAARAEALRILSKLIENYKCDWIKIDFNVDPGLGCNRIDHGHGEGDGLYEHYLGLYQVLDEIRGRFPEVTLENCSSGSLRIDLGMARHTHIAYLSDPDWPEHSLQVSWAAFSWLSPERCLHWVYSQWWDSNALPHQKFDPHNPSLTEKEIDFYTRISMLHGFGLSQRLPELPAWISSRFKKHIGLYKEVVRPHIAVAKVYKLTEQSLREGQGDRWAAFQFVAPNNEHLLFTFRLDGAAKTQRLQLREININFRYLLSELGQSQGEERTGLELQEGIVFNQLLENDSSILKISPVN